VKEKGNGEIETINECETDLHSSTFSFSPKKRNQRFSSQKLKKCFLGTLEIYRIVNDSKIKLT
jgi:hypothetical protein